jgi:di/tricarboxylate transporter
MNPGPTEEAAKAAGSFIDAMKQEPLSLALVLMNIALLVFFYFILTTVAAQREREITQLHQDDREVRDLSRSKAFSMTPIPPISTPPPISTRAMAASSNEPSRSPASWGALRRPFGLAPVICVTLRPVVSGLTQGYADDLHVRAKHAIDDARKLIGIGTRAGAANRHLLGAQVIEGVDSAVTLIGDADAHLVGAAFDPGELGAIELRRLPAEQRIEAGAAADRGKHRAVLGRDAVKPIGKP